MRRFACLAFVACCVAAPAMAQPAESTGQPSPEDLATKDSVTIGIAGAVVPDYEGSDDYRIIPAAAIRGQIHRIAFSTKGSYLYVNLVPRTSNKVEFDVGAIAGARLYRTRSVKDDIVDLLPQRKTAVELGGFAGVSIHGLTNPYDTLAIHADLVHDVANAHKSTTFSPNVDFSTPLSRTTYASLGVGAEFVGNKYADYYFSVTPADSVATGGVLPAFDADGGMKNWKVSLLLAQSLSGDLTHGFSIFGLGQYSRLVGDFKDSPLVSHRGSASQWLGAVGLAYTF